MFIVTVASRLLQSLEFFRSGFGRWFTILWQNFSVSKFFILPFVIYGVIRAFMSLFGSLCTSVSTKLASLNVQGIRVGGVDVLAFANSVLPLDELMGLVVVWFSIYSVCASIRFVRAAWSAIPFKAS